MMQTELVNSAARVAVSLNALATQLTEAGKRAGEQSKDGLAGILAGYANTIRIARDTLDEIVRNEAPSPDLLAAREAVIEHLKANPLFNKWQRRSLSLSVIEAGKSSYRTFDSGDHAVEEIANGHADDLALVDLARATATKAREMAEAAAEEQRQQAMLQPAAVARPATPDRLTITIDGPQGSGKTRMGEILRLAGSFQYRRPYEAAQYFLPDIIEIRDGRRFDVRNEEFLED